MFISAKIMYIKMKLSETTYLHTCINIVEKH